MTRIEADWLTTPETQRVFGALVDAGFQAFAVGGCVRDSLMGVPVKDIDLATNAVPDRVMALGDAAGFHVVPTGIDHGTVTLVSGGVAHEVTTYRRDVETDGRRATVAFAESIDEDARRRDFTMNALYADRDGAVHDPIGGLVDLKSRRVRFIEEAEMRIREDYLRSLRFFRFHAWYGDADQGFDPEAISAIAANLDGLEQLSRERVGAEVLKLLAAPDPAQSVAGMRTTGVLTALIPGADDTALGPLVHLEGDAEVGPDALRRLAVLGGDDLRARLRLSRKDAARLSEICKATSMADAEAGYRLGQSVATDGYLVRCASLGAHVEAEVLARISEASAQKFPVSAADLMPELNGPALGDALDRLEREWIESDFALRRDALLERVRDWG